MSFEGRIALITGSTIGIGVAMASLFASRSAHVIVTGRDVLWSGEVVPEIRALNALTKCWAAEYWPHGVRVNAVAAGPTHTEVTKEQYGVQALEKLAFRFLNGVIRNADGGRSAGAQNVGLLWCV